MAKKRTNGEGSVFRRKDGRYVGAAFVPTVGGGRKRVAAYGRTRLEAAQKLNELLGGAQAGVPAPSKQVLVADYLDYWLENFVKPNKQPRTWEQYEMVSRLYLKPALGSRQMKSLSVPLLQEYFNGLLAQGCSVRKVQIVRTGLSAALTRAQREELLTRNTARLVELPQWRPSEVEPWTADEARRFVQATAGHRLHAAFVMLVLYGLRRGEVLGLRWRDVDFDNSQLHIRQQLQRIGHDLTAGPLKTRASQRDLPLLPMTMAVLQAHLRQQLRARAELGGSWSGPGDDTEFVFTTPLGTPVDPKNFVRSFKLLCDKNGIRPIKLHHIRHTAATLMKNRGVPLRDVQFVLGHATPWMTTQIYQHDDLDTRAEELGKVEALIATADEEQIDRLSGGSDGLLSELLSSDGFVEEATSVQSGGPAGARTQDTLLKRPIQNGGKARITGVRRLLAGVDIQCLLGRVAIAVAIQVPLASPITPSLWAVNLRWYVRQQANIYHGSMLASIILRTA